MKSIAAKIAISISTVGALAALLAPASAQAVPLFARQTGMSCATCHFGGNFPELTKYGREFKLMGYTDGKRQTIPLAAMLQVSETRINTDPGQDKNGSLVPQQFSLFTGGKILDNVGAFVQWTSSYSPNQANQYVRHGGIDNTDVRFADKTKVGGKDLIYGVSLNNVPTVQDVFNTTAAWNVNPSAVPFQGPFQGYGQTTVVDGNVGGHVAGLGAYLDWNDFLYAELTGYQTADGAFSILRAGDDTVANRFLLKGTNPYWRFALHGDSGPHSWEVGTYGMVSDKYSDPTNSDSLTDRYKDYALDGQYQYSKGPHHASVQAAWIHENVSWDANAVANGNNTSDTLNSWRLRGSYMYHNKIGGSVGFFSNTGSTDAVVYNGSANGSPDTTGYILEADYIPIQKIKVALQYTGYNKFNGASNNYDGNGRNASDNNTWYLLGWFMF